VERAIGRLDSPDAGLGVDCTELEQHLHTILQASQAWLQLQQWCESTPSCSVLLYFGMRDGAARRTCTHRISKRSSRFI
jgi:hypothetical protein